MMSEAEVNKLIEEYQKKNESVVIFNKLFDNFQNAIHHIINKKIHVKMKDSWIYEDLYQEASITFLKCLKQYDPNKDSKFLSYVYQYIEWRLKRVISEGRFKVYAAKKIRDNSHVIFHFVDKYKSEHGEYPPYEIIYKELKCIKRERITEEDYEFILRNRICPSLNYLVNDEIENGELSLFDHSSSEENCILDINIKDALNDLKDDEREVFNLFFIKGFNTVEISKMMSKSQSVVYRLKQRSLIKFRLRFSFKDRYYNY